jgi:hypothetical protein
VEHQEKNIASALDNIALGRYSGFVTLFYMAQLSIRMLSLVTALVAAFFIGSPKPQDRPGDYWACKQLHPDRYCRLQHLPATVAQESNGNR